MNSLIAGSCLLVIARGALGTPFAAAVAKIYQDSVKALARNQTWRDIGSRRRAAMAGTALTVISPEMLHIGLAMAFGTLSVVRKFTGLAYSGI